MGKRQAISKKVLVKKGVHIIEVPIETIKAILADVGFAGNLLMKATGEVYKEVKSLSKQGVIHASDFEKAVVRGIKQTNDMAVDTTTKIVKKVLK